MPDRTIQTLFNIIFDKALPITQINTDCFSSYRTLSRVLDFDGNNFYNHYTVNHSKNFIDPITNTHTNNIKYFFSHFRKFFNKCSRKRFYLGAYIDEFFYRWNFLTENDKEIKFLKTLSGYDFMNN